MANIYGRQVVIPLTNKSGSSVAVGDVVVMDASNDTAFTTTTTGRYEGVVGIAQEAIASNATGRVLIQGYASLVNVPSSVTRGHYIETHTVAKQATGSGTRRSGSLGVFLTGGTTPTAVLGGLPDQTASGGGSFTFTGCKVTNSGSTALNNGSRTTVTFDTEEWDTTAFHSGSGSELTMPATGKYRVTAGGKFSTGGSSEADLFIVKNRTGTPVDLAVDTRPGGGAVAVGATVSWEGTLSSGDTISLQTYIDAGSKTLTIQFLSVQRLDP